MKVVDLSVDVAGRFAARLFTMAGAKVWRAQAPGDDALSIYLDGDKAVLPPGAPVADADLVFTSFDCGDFTGAGRERDRLPPRCVEITTSSFGTFGPYAAWRGGPVADWAAGGYLWVTGEPGREPLMGPEHLCAYVAGYAAAIGAEAALRARAGDGCGRHVDISTMDVMLGLHQSTFSRANAGFIRQRTGRYAEVYPLTVLPCAKGNVSLGIVSDEEFDRLAIAIGQPDLLADARFAGREARMRNCDALDAKLLAYLREHDAEAVVAALQAAGLAATVADDPQAVLANPQHGFRGFWNRPWQHPAALMPGNPVPASIRFPAAPQDRGDKAVLANPARDTRGLPLHGIVVLDLTAFWAGPSATRILADLGAEVIWIERPKSRIDFDDRLDDPQMRVHHLYHAKMNRHKRSIVLDLETPQGKAAARELAARADIVVENFRPGVAARLGLGPAELCGAFPDLVYVSLSGFGSAGPWGNWRSFGPNIEAASSILARTGYAGEGPMRLGHALPDGVGGLAGALAALRGLRERDELGHGGWFDVSQLEVYTAICGEEILTAARDGAEFPRIGNRSRSGAVQGVFPCLGTDEWIAVRLSGPDDLARFAGLSGLSGVQANSEEHIAEWTRGFDKHALAVRLQQAGIEALPVFRPDELLADPHLAARGSFVTVECGGHGDRLPASPLRCDPPLADCNGAAPRFGQHGAGILNALASPPLNPA
jgi:crotonobetainyl-CoA:carnitine CoA-transferase CaiB-like acyl-CoA transferase